MRLKTFFLVLFFPSFVFAATSAIVEPPTVVGSIPSQSIPINSPVLINPVTAIHCAPSQDSTIGNPQWSATGLWPGNAINTSTGRITGTSPATGQTTVITVSCTNDTAQVAQIAFSLTASVGTLATGYFVDCTAGTQSNDSYNGTSPIFISGTNGPWKTLGKVNAAVTAIGSDVWLKADTTCTNQTLTVDWTGTAASRVVVGTYYVSGGVAYQNVPTTPLLTNPQDGIVYGNGARAIIQGSYRPSCRTWPLRCAFYINASLNDPGNPPSAPSVPSSTYAAMVTTTAAAKYVTIQDLEIRDSAGAGIDLDSAPSSYCAGSSNCQMYNTIQRVKIDHIADTMMKIQRSSYIVIRENEFGYGNLARSGGHNVLGAGTGASNVVIWCSPCKVLIENNWLHDTQKEGFGFYSASHILARGNRSANQVQIHYYFEGAADIVGEQNIIGGGAYGIETGLGDPSWYPIQQVDGGRVVTFAIEPDPDGPTGPAIGGAGVNIPQIGHRHVFRNNLISSGGPCLTLGGDPLRADLGGGYVGNTCIGHSTGSSFSWNNLLSNGVHAEGIQFQNNIMALYPSGSMGSNTRGGAPITLGYNAWAATAPTAGGYSGTGDVTTTFANLAFGAYAWGTTSKDQFPVYTQFIPTAATTADDTAPTSMSNTYLTASEWTWVLAQRQWLAPCQETQVAEAEFVKLRTTDYCGDTPDTLGAINAFP